MVLLIAAVPKKVVPGFKTLLMPVAACLRREGKSVKMWQPKN